MSIDIKGFFYSYTKNGGIMMKKLVLYVLLGVLAILAGFGIYNNYFKTTDAGEDNGEKKTIVVGLDDTFAPMGFKDDNNELVGFDIDLSKEIEKITDYQFEFQPIDWMTKETELQQGNIDLIWNGYTVTDERKEIVAFSTPYMTNKQIIIIQDDSDIDSIDDLEGKTVATQEGSSSYDAIMADTDLVAAIEGNEPISYSTFNDVFNDLLTNRSDAIVVDETLARYYMKQRGLTELRVLDDDLGSEEYAIGIRKDDTQLKEDLDAALKTLTDNGKLDEVKNRWFEE